MQCVWLAVAQTAYFYSQDGFNGNAHTCCNVCSCWCLDLHTSVSHCYRFCALSGLAGHFGKIQRWVKCTSLDSSRCVFYSGIRFKSSRAASSKLEQDKWWKAWFSSGHLVVLLLIYYYYFWYNFFLMDDRPVGDTHI